MRPRLYLRAPDERDFLEPLWVEDGDPPQVHSSGSLPWFSPAFALWGIRAQLLLGTGYYTVTDDRRYLKRPAAIPLAPLRGIQDQLCVPEGVLHPMWIDGGLEIQAQEPSQSPDVLVEEQADMGRSAPPPTMDSIEAEAQPPASAPEQPLPSQASAPVQPAPAITELFQGVQVTRSADGGMRLDADPTAANQLATLLEGLAGLLRSANAQSPAGGA